MTIAKYCKTLPGCLLLLASTAVMAVEFSLNDLDGRPHALGDYRGKWVIINFWATTCPPCLQEIPELSDFHRRHKDTDAVVLGINFEDIRPAWLRAFIDSVDMNYPVLPWGTDPATPLGYVMMLPTTYIISPDGEIKGRQRGAITAQALDTYLEQQRHSEPAE